MSIANRRKKQPEVVRAELIRAAIDIAASEGMPAVTLDAVSTRAGVTRGGLQHHFHGRKALMDAVFDEMHDRFVAKVDAEIEADPVDAGRKTRAFVRVMTSKPEVEGENNILRALLIMLMSEPCDDDCWKEQWAETDLSPADEARLTLCRMAASGLMMSDLIDRKALEPELREEVVRQLVKHTYPDG
jgi:AcrR family transcriptional regulator